MVAWQNLSQDTIVVVAFGGIVERGFGNLQMEPMFDRPNNGRGIWWRLTKVEEYWEIAKGAKPKSDQRPTGLKKRF